MTPKKSTPLHCALKKSYLQFGVYIHTHTGACVSLSSVFSLMTVCVAGTPASSGSSAISLTKITVPNSCPAHCFLSINDRNQWSVTVLSKSTLFSAHNKSPKACSTHKESLSCPYIDATLRAHSKSRASCLTG